MFSWLDVILFLVLLWALLRGLRQGLIRIIFGFLALGLALWISCRFFGQLAQLLENWLSWPPLLLQILVFTALWLIVFWLICLLGNALRKIIHLTPLGILDTSGGAFLGLIKGAVFVALIFFPLFLLQANQLLPGFIGQAVNKSYLVRQSRPLFLELSRALNHFLPAEEFFTKKNVFFFLSKKFQNLPAGIPVIKL